MSAKLYEDFALLSIKDQSDVLIFEKNVAHWSDDQLNRELNSTRPAYDLLCSLATDVDSDAERVRLIYHSRLMDLRMTILRDEVARRELR